MAYDQLMSSYVGRGTHAARPASPNVAAGVSPIYYETDTTNTFLWTGSAWTQINGGGGAASLSVSTKTTTYTISSSDDVILADATGGAFTVSLPTAVGWTKRITILKIDSGTNAVTVGTTGGQTINGQSTRLLKGQFSAITLVSDNSNWRTSEEALPLTSKGDLLVGLAANDVQRLAVGGDGLFLAADSSQATGVKWGAPGMTLISDQTVTGSVAANIACNSLGSYNHLLLRYQARGDTAATNAALRVQFNSDSTSGHYASERAEFYTGNSANGSEVTSDTGLTLAYFSAATAPASAAGQGSLLIDNYAGTTWHKTVNAEYSARFATGAGGIVRGIAVGYWLSTAAITSILLFPSAGNFAVGSRFTLYGLT